MSKKPRTRQQSRRLRHRLDDEIRSRLEALSDAELEALAGPRDPELDAAIRSLSDVELEACLSGDRRPLLTRLGAPASRLRR